jgi:hypothetical protein
MNTTAVHSFYIGPIGSFYNQVNTNTFHLSNGRFHLSRTIGQTLLSRPECLKMVLTPEIVI